MPRIHVTDEAEADAWTRAFSRINPTQDGPQTPVEMAGPWPLDRAQLTRARLRIAWETLTEVGEHLDLVPTAARAHVAQALADLVMARAIDAHCGTARRLA